MINSVIVVGNLGADVEVRHSAGGTAMANFRLAVNEHFKNKDGEKQQKTHWFTCTAFGRNAEILAQYTKKGNKVGVVGSLSERSWEDKDGNKRNVVEIRANSIELLGGKADGNGNGNGGTKQQHDSGPPPMDDDDSIPF